MKKKEKLKSPTVHKKTRNTATKTPIILSDFEIRQAAGPPKFGFVPQGTGHWVPTGILGGHPGTDEAFMTDTNTIWGTKTEVDAMYDCMNGCMDWTDLA